MPSLKPVELPDLKLAALKALDLPPDRVQVHFVNKTAFAYGATSSPADSARVRTILLLVLYCRLESHFSG